MSLTANIRIENFSKTYPGNIEPAVRNLSLEIHPGELYGLLGPNGAGKTTTISSICGLLPFDKGQITVAGFDVQKQLSSIKHAIGVVGQDLALYAKLTAEENLRYFGSMYGIDKSTLQQRSEKLLKRLDLYQYRHKALGTYSGGMKRRINLIAGVLHRPSIVFLDEPMVGIDVQTRHAIRDYLREMNEQGTTLIYTSHLLEDAEKLCSKVGIIDHGSLICEGTPAGLIAEHADCHSLEEVFLKLTGKSIRES